MTTITQQPGRQPGQPGIASPDEMRREAVESAARRRTEYERLTNPLSADDAAETARLIVRAAALARAEIEPNIDCPVDVEGVPLANDTLAFKICMAARKARGEL